LELRRVLHWNKEAVCGVVCFGILLEAHLGLQLDLLLNENVDFMDHKTSLLSVYNLLPEEQRQPNIEQLPDDELKQLFQRVFTNNLFHLARTMIMQYAQAHRDRERPKEEAEMTLQLWLKLYTMLEDDSLPNESPLAQFITGLFRNMVEQSHTVRITLSWYLATYLTWLYSVTSNAT